MIEIRKHLKAFSFLPPGEPQDTSSQKAGKGAYSQPFHVILFGAVRFIKAIFAPVMPGCKAPFEAAKRPLTCWRHEARPL